MCRRKVGGRPEEVAERKSGLLADRVERAEAHVGCWAVALSKDMESTKSKRRAGEPRLEGEVCARGSKEARRCGDNQSLG